MIDLIGCPSSPCCAQDRSSAPGDVRAHTHAGAWGTPAHTADARTHARTRTRAFKNARTRRCTRASEHAHAHASTRTRAHACAGQSRCTPRRQHLWVRVYDLAAAGFPDLPASALALVPPKGLAAATVGPEAARLLAPGRELRHYNDQRRISRRAAGESRHDVFECTFDGAKVRPAS